MNSVFLIGRLTKDPEVTYSTTGTAITKFVLAIDRPKRDGADNGADFIRITCFGRQAEICDQYLSKGRQVAIQGRIQTGSYQNREGQTIYTTDVIAERVEFIGNRNNDAQAGNSAPQQSFAPVPEKQPTTYQTQLDLPDLPDSFEQAEDDIPF